MSRRVVLTPEEREAAVRELADRMTPEARESLRQREREAEESARRRAERFAAENAERLGWRRRDEKDGERS